jgi:hypothetical protein
VGVILPLRSIFEEGAKMAIMKHQKTTTGFLWRSRGMLVRNRPFVAMAVGLLLVGAFGFVYPGARSGILGEDVMEGVMTEE